jgi:hypothetical protein
MTPKALERVVARCLAKDPEEQWQSANDLTSELKWIAEGTAPVAAGTRTTLGRKRELFFSALAVVLAGVAAWSFLRPSPKAEPSITKLEMSLPYDQEVGGFGPFLPRETVWRTSLGQETERGDSTSARWTNLTLRLLPAPKARQMCSFLPTASG